MDKFLELMNAQNGFEICLGFRDFEDHYLGGKGNTVWYYIDKGRTTEAWIGELKDGVWTDRHLVKKRKLTEEPAKPGTTIAMISERAYFKQEELADSGRKAVHTEIRGFSCSHYVFSFGARAYDILDDFGITASYSNIDDEQAGWSLRGVNVGEKVQLNEIK